MKILGLDLATSTGYAFNDDQGVFYCGSWLLATEPELKAARKQRLNRRLDPRVTKLFQKVQDLHTEFNFDIIVFEDVQFASSTLQCQLWSSLRAAIWLAPKAKKQPVFEAVPVQTLKLFATGHGGATKEMMIKALAKSDPRFMVIKGKPELALFNPNPAVLHAQVVDDNAVDATWLWKWADQFLGRMKI